MNYALSSKKKNNTIVTKVKKVAIFVFNIFSIKNFDITKYEKLVYFSFNTCKFVYYSKINRIQFILDFEATIYIYCEKAYFRKIIFCNSIVLWGKISHIKAFEIGFVSIIFSDTSVKTILQNCLYISKFKINLIFVQKLIKNYKMIFDKYCKMYTRDATKLILCTKINNRLFSFPIINNIAKITNTTISSNTNTIQMNNVLKIHRWLNYIEFNALKKLLINNLHNITQLIC